MNPSEAETLAHDLMDQFALDDWTFVWMRSKVTFGQCRRRIFGPNPVQEIRLSKPLTALNALEQVSDTLRHEIAHAIAPLNAGHGPQWKAACHLTGARPTRCYNSTDVELPPARWSFRCDACGFVGQRERKPSRTALHTPCGNAGTLAWTQTEKNA